MSDTSGPKFSWHLAGTVLLLAATLTGSLLASHRKTEFLEQPLDMISQRIAGFNSTDNPPLDEHTLAALRATSYLSREYRKPGGLLADLFIAFYAQQRAAESMHSPRHCLPGAGWEILSYDTTNIPVNGQTFTVNQYTISHESNRDFIFYWYQSKRRIIASEYMGKILLARDTLLQNGTAASIVRIIVPLGPGAIEEARGFAAELIPQVQHCFGD